MGSTREGNLLAEAVNGPPEYDDTLTLHHAIQGAWPRRGRQP